MSPVDRTLVCRDCGREFVFTAGEQDFYASKGLTNDPARCPSCRASRKSAMSRNSFEAPEDTGYVRYEKFA
ncbi:MAG TPA: zinc-ribbon domain-containing protein, partial [Dehalococcoidia bacterium]|nr:zinc-ribbon domain-containing protein [Dehalococcoidia bacterium]